MKKGGVVLLIFALILIAGYNALSKMTVDVNPASIARDMSPEEKAENQKYWTKDASNIAAAATAEGGAPAEGG